MLPQTITSVLFLAATATAQVIFNWDCTNSKGPCNNACYAIRKAGKGATLTYDTNAANRNPRRTASGCNRTPCSNTALPYRNFGNSCDEFPFASTTQGGAGAILRCVASTENSSEGGQLSAFYNGRANGTRFNVAVINYTGLQFCEKTPVPANDGGEFRLVNGAFANAKRVIRRSVGFFEDVAPQEGLEHAKVFREYEDEEGVRVLSLAGLDVDLLGQTMERGNRTVRIVKEIGTY
ncbi:Deoxyribonuclease NucA/NucB domain containing protein [Rhypophila sp. PSN 637]